MNVTEGGFDVSQGDYQRSREAARKRMEHLKTEMSGEDT